MDLLASINMEIENQYHVDLGHLLAFNIITFPRLHLPGYFMADKDSSLEKLVFNHIVTLRDSYGVHFWAPTFKWGISIANIADFAKPPEKLSYPQQIATGIIWSHYSTVITPKNWNLFNVNVAMAGTGIYQLSPKIKHDYFSEEERAVATE